MKLTKEILGEDVWNKVIDDWEDTSFREHYKGSTFIVKLIFKITEEKFPNLNPEYYGLWESNTVAWCDDWGIEWEELSDLTKVEKVSYEKTIIVTEYKEL